MVITRSCVFILVDGEPIRVLSRATSSRNFEMGDAYGGISNLELRGFGTSTTESCHVD